MKFHLEATITICNASNVPRLAKIVVHAIFRPSIMCQCVTFYTLKCRSAAHFKTNTGLMRKLLSILLPVRTNLSLQSHLLFKGGGFTSQRGTFGTVAKLDTMMSVAFGKDPLYAYSCGSSGSVYVWKGRTLERTVMAHQGPCFAMHSLDKVLLTASYQVV